MSNRIEPELPSITPDIDDVSTFKSHRQSSKGNSTTTLPNDETSIASSPAKTSLANKLALVAIYLGLSGASYWFYQQNVQLIAEQNAAEQRIAKLEQQLSATGEEIGESTVALKVKLEALTEKTNELWSEMDKLWASAWRRNQSEIKELRANTIKMDKTLDDNSKVITSLASKTQLNELKDKVTAAEFSLNALSEKSAASESLKADLTALANRLTTLSQTADKREQQQLEVVTTVNQFDTTIQLLVERIDQLEAQLKLQADKPLAPAQIN
ncbi:hypothetical protein [Thalassotalea ganghwensis]